VIEKHIMASVSKPPEKGRRIVRSAEVLAYGRSEKTRDEIALLRRKPGGSPEGWPALQPALLRNCDDQTVAALVAVHAAIARLDSSDPRTVADWGILASSRFLGRSSLVVALNRFRSEGVWAVSPHLIPHYALHSPAGMLSLALGVHGPNLGVGGGASAAFEGLLTAITWLDAKVVPGLWLVLTGWSPELVPDQAGEPIADCWCHALALALGPPSVSGPERPNLRLMQGPDTPNGHTGDLAVLGKLLDQYSASQQRLSRISSDRIVHDGLSHPRVPRPHFVPRAANRAQAYTIARDHSTTHWVELVLHQPSRSKEAG
jgi:hypothetical protein